MVHNLLKENICKDKSLLNGIQFFCTIKIQFPFLIDGKITEHQNVKSMEKLLSQVGASLKNNFRSITSNPYMDGGVREIVKLYCCNKKIEWACLFIIILYYFYTSPKKRRYSCNLQINHGNLRLVSPNRVAP